MSKTEEISEKVEKLNIALLLLINSLRGNEDIPKTTLDVIEKLITENNKSKIGENYGKIKL